jgi:hypothetical protein
MGLLNQIENMLPGKHPTRPPVSQYTEEEKKEIRKLMRKHGLDREVIVEEPEGRFFFRDGQKMRFK